MFVVGVLVVRLYLFDEQLQAAAVAFEQHNSKATSEITAVPRRRWRRRRRRTTGRAGGRSRARVAWTTRRVAASQHADGASSRKTNNGIGIARARAHTLTNEHAGDGGVNTPGYRIDAPGETRRTTLLGRTPGRGGRRTRRPGVGDVVCGGEIRAAPSAATRGSGGGTTRRERRERRGAPSSDGRRIGRCRRPIGRPGVAARAASPPRGGCRGRAPGGRGPVAPVGRRRRGTTRPDAMRSVAEALLLLPPPPPTTTPDRDAVAARLAMGRNEFPFTFSDTTSGDRTKRSVRLHHTGVCRPTFFTSRAQDTQLLYGTG